ncbi:MAG: hypothetical protein RIE86_06225 [Imperialibacter sp.]|uniref:hypothetical protein n=1 Tax=Imperialibacter sp. TaxID=2038411 RepID=UPI0032EB7813
MIDETEESDLNRQIKKLETRKSISKNLSIILNSIVLFVVLWNLANLSMFLDLNREGAWVILAALVSAIFYHQADTKLLKLKLKALEKRTSNKHK